MRRIDYSGVVMGDAEREAVMRVLASPETMRIGRCVAGMEERVAPLLGKSGAVMVNSGSSALQLAVELLHLPEGAEVITPVVTFSTTVAPLVRQRLVPVFVDVEVDTVNVDVGRIEALIGPETRAMVVPNLAGNVPDWDALREIADRHGLRVVEDSCDTLGAKLRGRRTGERSDISVTSFATSHIITAGGHGGMLALDDEALRDEALLLRRWGRSSETRFFGSRRDERGRFVEPVDGVEYDALFVFEAIGHNFEPNEMGAAFGLAQLDRLEANTAARRARKAEHDAFFAAYPDRFAAPRQLPGLETAWLQYPIRILPGAGFTRAQAQAFLKERGIQTRMVWSGNLLRQPGFREIRCRRDPAGYPQADAVMEQGLLLPVHHALDDEDMAWLHGAFRELVDAF